MASLWRALLTTALVLHARLVLATSDGKVMSLHHVFNPLTELNPERRKAVFLDGSPAAYWHAPATDPAMARDWLIFLEGGGFCPTLEQCHERAKSYLGTSRGIPRVLPQKGFVSELAEQSDYASANRVFVHYCDGLFYAGDAHVDGLDFAGIHILEQTIDVLAERHGLDRAEKVMLAGCSAGATATIFHADRVGARVAKLAPALRTYAAVPASGFFPTRPGVVAHMAGEQYGAFVQMISGAMQRGNGIAHVVEACLAHWEPRGESWRCAFANETMPFVNTPMFLLQSAYDSFQSCCMLTEGKHGGCFGIWKDCFYPGTLGNCTQVQKHAFTVWSRGLVEDLNAVLALKRSNGAFVHSCYEHCGANHPLFDTISINGVSMRSALRAWWTTLVSAGDVNGTAHRHWPCEWQGDSVRCNPTCPDPNKIPPAVLP